MRFWVRHKSRTRLRVHLDKKHLSFEEAGALEEYLKKLPGVADAKVYERTADAAISLCGAQEPVLTAIQKMDFEEVLLLPQESDIQSRQLNAMYREKLIMKVTGRALRRLLLPQWIRIPWTVLQSLRYIRSGLSCLRRGRIEVPVLDAAAITVSLLRGSFSTAGSTMFLLEIGELLEEWTHKKSVNDLARSMSLKIGSVWIRADGQELLVPADSVQAGDEVIVRMSNVIPFDGEVCAGEGMVNQSSLTGESVPVRKIAGDTVYAGTVLEEGEISFRVRESSGKTRYEQIIRMIEDSEKLKSAAEGRAEHLADKLVPYALLGTGLTYLLTRNATRALSFLMVDFSCALKLAMPVSVLSAIREAGNYSITVKGGKYLEAVSEADMIVFDKTGTLTAAKPRVADIVPFCPVQTDELLRIAACLEEHFPHSMAKAVVTAARERGLEHEEMHSRVEYIVAHGIASSINDKKVIIGSYHFVFEDEGCIIGEEYKDSFEKLPDCYSHLYMAVDGKLAAVICIEDPIRPEAAEAIRKLRECGIRKVVMMTGDSERTAAAVAAQIGVDEYYSEVLPEDKAGYIQQAKARGEKLIMIGDGINDSPALSAADAGIAISDGAEIAREIADIIIMADDLNCLVTLRQISTLQMKRIYRNYRQIMGFNSLLILLGVFGLLQPAASSLLHNTSTIAIGLHSMRNLL